MSNIIEILGEKKYYNAENNGLKINFNLAKSDEINFERNKFYKLSQEEQFQIEKNNSLLFRFYGKINPIFNLNFTETFIEKPTLENFKINKKENWELGLLRPTQNNKGIPDFTFNYKEWSKKVDFTNGLPLIKSKYKKIRGKERVGLFSFFKHNFKVGDLIELNSSATTISSGIYRILDVVGNYFYIDLEHQDATIVITTPEKPFKTGINSGIDINKALTFTSGTTTETLFDVTDDIQFNPIRLLNSNIYGKRYSNKTLCEYYIKTLTLIDKIEVLDECAFSRNIFNQEIFTYTQNKIYDFNSIVDNLGNPISEVYLGFFKKAGGSDYNFSNVVSTFDNLISNTYVDTGLETISMKKNIDINDLFILSTDDINNNLIFVNNQTEIISENIDTGTITFDLKTIWEDSTTPNISDILMYGLVEYDKENLEEISLNKINYTFYGNEQNENSIIRFSYDPFYKMDIRKFSNSIEESNFSGDAASYAVYNEKYQTYRWKELLNIGLYEDEGNGIDLPFLNGMFYVFQDVIFIVRTHNTKVYEKNTSILSSDVVNFDYLSDESISEKPFEEYNKRKKCVND